MDERRKIKRKILMFFARVYDKDSREFIGHLADLTRDGAMIISQLPIDVGKEFRLNVELPRGEFSRGFLNFRAKSVWGHPDLDPKYYNTGFKLLEVSAEDLEIVDKILQGYGIR